MPADPRRPDVGGIASWASKALSILLLVVLVLATWALRVRRAPVAVALALRRPLTVAVILIVPDDEHWLRLVARGAGGCSPASSPSRLLRYVLDLAPHHHRQGVRRGRRLRADRHHLRLPVAWLQYVEAQRLPHRQVNDPDGKLSWSELMYFSFTVLTSTGFGEITPVTDMARSLIVIEQVLGVMYVAFLVARLANLYGRDRRR